MPLYLTKFVPGFCPVPTVSADNSRDPYRCFQRQRKSLQGRVSSWAAILLFPPTVRWGGGEGSWRGRRRPSSHPKPVVSAGDHCRPRRRHVREGAAHQSLGRRGRIHAPPAVRWGGEENGEMRVGGGSANQVIVVPRPSSQLAKSVAPVVTHPSPGRPSVARSA